MRTPTNAVSSSTTSQAVDPNPGLGGRVLTTPVALTTLRIAVGLAVAGDVLFRGEPGLSVPIWFGLLCLGIIALIAQAGGGLRHESLAWLAVAFLFAAACAWRDADELRFLNFVAAVFALGLAALTIHNERVRIFAIRVRDVVWGALRTGLGAATGLVPLVLWDLRDASVGSTWKRSTRVFVRIAVVVVPLVLVFGALLRGADPIFASFVSIPAIDVGEVISHIFVIGFFSWILAGIARSTLAAPSDREAIADVPPFRLGLLETTAALVTLNVLFAAFVLAQLGWLFGGEAFLHARTGLSAAEYARRGFFQTVFTVVLLVPLLVALRAAVAGNEPARARHTALALPLAGLVGVTIVSAFLRMQLYVRYFGLSTDRLYALVALCWLGVVLVWFCSTMVARREHAFVGGSVVAGLLAIAALNVGSPDAIVARTNVARAATQQPQTPLDLSYLTWLSGEAMPMTVNAVLASADEAERCQAARSILNRWGPESGRRIAMDKPGAWRAWNAGERAAIHLVEQRGAELRAASHVGCPRPKAAPTATSNR